MKVLKVQGVLKVLKVRCTVLVQVLVLVPVLVQAQPARRAEQYEATIRRTAYGIPHISARDLPSLMFGEGYAFAQDHLCSLADQVILARGERAKYLGPGPNDRHVNSDVTMRALRIAERAAELVTAMPGEQRRALEAYADGYNKYLAEVGVAAVPGWCRGAAWVQPLTATDVAARMQVVGLTLAQVPSWIATAAPPAPGTVAPQPETLDAEARLSNGWAIGKERSENGRGLLLANPHYPWVGANRFWEKHLTIPGQLDVYGVHLLGVPGVAIGFNKHVAWTHTVSAGMRMTGYALRLVPGKPTTYIYDGQSREMTKRDIDVDVRQGDGTTKRVTRTVYYSHHGPIVNFPGLAWISTRAVAIRDANADASRLSETHAALARATTLEEVKRAHALGGTAFVNTMVATADGRAFYIDASSAPNLSDHAIAWWKSQVAVEGDVQAADARGLMLLDGSDARFEWVNAPGAPAPGLVPTSNVPQVERADYVFNANDSHWISHPRAPLTGFSPVHGAERTLRSLRTRMNVRLLDDVTSSGASGRDGKFSIDEIWSAVFSNRAMSAELLKSSLVERCQAGASDQSRAWLANACRVLAQWDGTYNLDSRGAVLWREFIMQFRGPDIARLFATPFDAGDPLSTPRGLATPGDGKDLALDALARAAEILERGRVPLDAPLGQVQYAQRGDRRLPIHGGFGDPEGIANFVNYAPNGTTAEPDVAIAPMVEGSRTLTRDGYPINRGSSFVMVVGFTDDGPRARAVLTYGESGDPRSPHFGDQTELFSRKGWREILFSEAQIRSDQARQTKVVSGSGVR